VGRLVRDGTNPTRELRNNGDQQIITETNLEKIITETNLYI
jgi:hypothetical protein